MQNKNFQDLTVKISDVCSREQGINAAYLFGSVAKGKAELSSDVDLAILVDEDCLQKFSLLSFISLLERSSGCRADVVILNRAGEVLKYEVRRSGQLIFERDSQMRKRFEVLGRKTHEDFLYLHRRYANSVLYGENHG
jgi:predicted nucleotidyltransferase